jgi:hypothetical protein
MIVILKKIALPSGDQNEASPRPHQEWDKSETKLNNGSGEMLEKNKS